MNSKRCFGSLVAAIAVVTGVGVSNTADAATPLPPAEFTNANWPMTFNGATNNSDFANNVVVDKQGNVFVTGTTSFGGLYGDFSRGMVRKYDCSGNLLWEDVFSGPTPANEFAAALSLDPTETFVYVVGQTLDTVLPGNYQAHVRKYNASSGSMSNPPVWVTSDSGSYDRSTSGAEAISAVAVDSAGYVFTTGTYQVSGGNHNWFVDKRDPAAGNIVWTQVVDGPFVGKTGSNDSARSITVTQSNRVLVGGLLAMSAGSGGDAILQEFNNATGTPTQIWQVDNGSQDIFVDLSVDAVNNVLYAAMQTNVSGHDTWNVRKYNLATNSEILSGAWPVSYHFNNQPCGIHSIQYDPFNDIVVVAGDGQDGLGDPYVQWRITALTPKGAAAWSSDIVYNTPGSPSFSESVLDHAVDCYGNIVAAGYREPFPQNPATGQPDWRIAKYGNGTQCNCTISPAPPGPPGQSGSINRTDHLTTPAGCIASGSAGSKVSWKVTTASTTPTPCVATLTVTNAFNTVVFTSSVTIADPPGWGDLEWFGKDTCGVELSGTFNVQITGCGFTYTDSVCVQ